MYGIRALEQAARPYTPARIEKFISDGTILIGFLEDRMIGCVIAGQGMIHGLFVLQEYQRKGFGAKLLQTAIDQIKDTAIKRIAVFASLSSVGFYKRQGFLKLSHNYNRYVETVIMHQPFTPEDASFSLPFSFRFSAVRLYGSFLFALLREKNVEEYDRKS